MQAKSIVPMVALGVLSLLQRASAEPRPKFAVVVSVAETSRVSTAVTATDSAVAAINAAVQGYTISSELELLPGVADIIADIANQFQPLGVAVVGAIGALETDTSGDVAGLFGAALDAVDAAIAFGDDTLPGLRGPLVPLVGTDLPDKLLDCFQHIGKALQALLVSLDALKTDAEAAAAASGSSKNSAAVVSSNLPRTAVTQLVYGLHLLKGTVPALEYVVQSTMEGIALADAFMLELDAAVDSVIGDSSTLVLELDAFLDPLEASIVGSLTSLGVATGQLTAGFGDLANLGTASSAPALGSVLDDFQGNLDALGAADPSVSDVLGQLGVAFTDAYDVVDPLYYIYESALVDALMTTLVANGDYSQYCFYKYKEFFFVLLEYIALAASDCIAEEALRMEYYHDTVVLMLDLLFYDVADIADSLDICERIDDADNLQECTSKFVDIYSALEGSFGDKMTLAYQSLQHEIAASGNRLKICIRLSQSELSDTEVPLLLAKINACAEDGPYAEDD